MQRIPQLDGLRALAILMVFAAHAFNVPFLWTGVDLFFVLSGYLITRILLRLKEQRATAGYFAAFYTRRARRILPPYLMFLAMAGLMFSLPWAHIWYWYVFFGANFPLALGKSPSAALTPLWSLAVEEQFYLVWPLIVLCCSKQSLRRVALATVLLSPVIRAAATPLFSSHFPTYCLTIFRADTLAFGAFLAVVQSEDDQWILRNRLACLYGSISAAMLLALLAVRPSFRPAANSILFNSLGYSLSVIIFGGALVYVLATERGMVHSLLTSRTSRYLGQVSYSYYLYHVAILEKMRLYVSSSWVRGITSFALTLGVAALSWHLMEGPILQGRGRNWRIRLTKAESDAVTELRSEVL